MAIVCPVCGTENRSIAKFCIECIAPLPVGFAKTQAMPEAAPVPDDMPSALAAFASAGPPSPLMAPLKLPALPGDYAARRPGRTLRRTVAGAAVLALVLGGIAVWLTAGGAGGRDASERASAVQGEQNRRAAGVLEAPSPPPSPAPAPVAPVLAEEPAPSPAEALAPGEAIVAPGAAPPASAPHQPATTAASPAAARAVAAAAVAPVPAPAPAQQTTTKIEHAPPLFSRCDGLNFIAASRCRVELCETPAHRERKECQPVLAQQRTIEEKRNPVAN